MNSNKILIMISSRCKDSFPLVDGKSLSEIRKELKREIEGTTLFNKAIFEVWINEEETSQSGTQDSWDICLKMVKECDILISLYNGRAGWVTPGGDVGICHAELKTGVDVAPAKVRLIKLKDTLVAKDEKETLRDERFQEYVSTQNFFRIEVLTIDELKQEVKAVIIMATINLLKSGVMAASQGKYHGGNALNWSRLNYKTRHDEMRRVLAETLSQKPGAREMGQGVLVPLAGSTPILFIPEAIPDSFSISQAREMVGKPFLQDHLQLTSISNNMGGPVHIIACHKGATESQAKNMLGFPDATVVTTPFGVFVADNIQKIQFVFIANCRDDTNTRHGVQRFFEWMRQNNEDEYLTKRAISRAKIIQSIKQELDH